MSENTKLFEINGFAVHKGFTYSIKNKADLNAPSGFVQEGTTKLPSGVDEMFQCRTSEEGLWDTGFFAYSPCYSAMEETEATKAAKAVFENVAKPYMRQKGITDKDLLSPNNDDWWKLQNFRIWPGRVYNSNNPVDVFELYMALNAYQLTPKDQEKDPRYSRSSYVIVDTTKAKKVKEERTENKFKAIKSFTNTLDTNRSALVNILYYLDLKVSDKSSDESLMTLFDEIISSADDKLRLFASAMKDLDNDKFDKYIIYRKLNSLYGSKVIRKSNGVFTYDGIEIGEDLKSASENIEKNPKLSEIKNEIILTDED